MSTLQAVVALLVSIVTIGVAAMVLALAIRTQVEAEALAARVGALRPAAPLPPSLAALAEGPRKVMVVELLNPVEIASSHSKAAAVLGAAHPSLLAKIVYDQTLKHTRIQLAEQGVKAEVQLHVVD